MACVVSAVAFLCVVVIKQGKNIQEVKTIFRNVILVDLQTVMITTRVDKKIYIWSQLKIQNTTMSNRLLM